MAYRVTWLGWNRRVKRSVVSSRRCERYEEALTLKDALEERGAAEVTVEEEE